MVPASTVRTVAVVLAGGTGTRVGLGIPKQLIKVAGKTILEHTLDVFQAAPDVDEIVLLMAPGFVRDAEAVVGRRYPKLSKILEGGDTRNATTRIALDALGHDECKVLFHDAVRPLLEQRIIADCVRALDTHDAVDVAIPSTDTIIAVDDEAISEIPQRSRLRRGQTPQAFRLATIRAAYALARRDPDFSATDDCGVVMRYLPEVAIHVVEGSEQNLKITHPIDIFIADKLFQLASQTPPSALDDEAYRQALTGRTLVVLGGSYGIGADVAALARGYGADVFTYSRSQTGTHVDRPADVEAALRDASERSGRIDYVVVTAGLLRRGPLSLTSLDDMRESVEVNYLAPLYAARFALAHLERTEGQLLLYTSSSYTRGRAGYSVYSSTKAAVVNLAQALADEWAPLGVRVNCINPERTATPMRRNAFGDEPADSLLTSDQVARTSLDVLLSSTTGHVVDVRRQDFVSDETDADLPVGAGKGAGKGMGTGEPEQESIAAALAEAETAAETGTAAEGEV